MGESPEIGPIRLKETAVGVQHPDPLLMGSQESNKRLTQPFGRRQLAAVSDLRPFTNSRSVTVPQMTWGVGC